MFLLVTEGQALFYIFIFIVGFVFWIPAFIVKNKAYIFAFTILSAMVFTYMAFSLSEETILLLVFIGLVIIQIISLFYLKGSEK